MGFTLKRKRPARKTFKLIFEKLTNPCKCGRVDKKHCDAFPDNVWFGCLKNKLLDKKD